MPKRRDEQAPYWQQLRVAERGIIEYALEHGKTIRGTAVILGISPNYLGERLRLLGIPVPDVRPGPKPGTKRPARPQLRVVAEEPTPEPEPDESEDEDSPNDDVLEDEEDEAEEGQDDDEGDPWEDGEDEDEDDKDDGDGESEDANAQGN